MMSLRVLFLLAAAALSCCHVVQAFSTPTVVKSFHATSPTTTTTTSTATTSTRLHMATVEEDTTSVTPKGLLKRDRYIATNRFAVRLGKAAKLEQRWASRKSRLAELQGFRYFHLMRRVTLNDDGTSTFDEGTTDDEAQGNYVSFTIWDKKSDFSAWRSGEAFVEAHGGKSLGAFVSTMVNSLRTLRGAPKPAFYDGLLLQSTTPENVAEVVDGWRNVEADGVNTLPTECFVACNQFFVSPENAAAFEQRWASRESKLKECDGFVAFSMLRRDASAKGHGVVPLSSGEPSYTSTTIWRDRQAFEDWKNGGAFKQAHGEGKPKSDEKENKPASPPAPLWSQPPKPVFYEGTLVITSKDGA